MCAILFFIPTLVLFALHVRRVKGLQISESPAPLIWVILFNGCCILLMLQWGKCGKQLLEISQEPLSR